MIQFYESKFEEASFANNQILRAIFLTNKLVSKRIGTKIYMSSIPSEYINQNGKFAGIDCLFSNLRRIRYSWRMGRNSEITTIDFWLTKRKGIKPPDFTLNVEGLNIVKLIDVISEIINGNIKPEFQVITESIKIKKEDFSPRSGRVKSSEITKALKQWAIDKDIDDSKLETTRISHLYRDWLYWYQEMASPEFQMMSEMTFRSYIIDFLNSRGLKNIYIRDIKVKKGGKEKIINTDKASEAAYEDISHLEMNVEEMKEFMGDSLRAVARGYRNSLIITGKSGFGKTSLTEKILKEEGMKITSIQQIRNIKVLYNLFAQHGSPKDVILFDDTPDTFDKKFSGYLSAALDDKPKRVISFPSEMGKDLQDLKKFQPELLFQGKIVILTNKTKKEIPSYLKSRSITIEVQADINLMADNIRKHLLNILPKVDMKDKLEVLEFIEKLGKHISSIDYRTYMLCVIFKISDSPDWKKRVYGLLK